VSTHRRELEELQKKLRDSGQVCNFWIGPEGIESVFFRDKWRDPLSFAEMARPLAAWWNGSPTYLMPGGRP
jgi:hypothetical protein